MLCFGGGEEVVYVDDERLVVRYVCGIAVWRVEEGIVGDDEFVCLLEGLVCEGECRFRLVRGEEDAQKRRYSE